MKIELSDNQKKALKHEKINAFSGLMGGVLGFINSVDTNEASLGTHLFNALLTGAMASFLSSFIFPINTKDILDFKEQNTNE